MDACMTVSRSPWHCGFVLLPCITRSICHKAETVFSSILPALGFARIGKLIIWHANEPKSLTRNMGNNDFIRWI